MKLIGARELTTSWLVACKLVTELIVSRNLTTAWLVAWKLITELICFVLKVGIEGPYTPLACNREVKTA